MSAPTLLVIDMQEVFARPDSPWGMACYARVAARVAALLPGFAGRTVFTRFIPPATIAGSWVGYYAKWPFAAAAPPDDPLWAVTPPFQPGWTHDTHQFSKWTPALRERLGPAPELVLCGVATDCCVLATALAAIEDGAQVRVAAGACGAGTQAQHDAALALLRLRAPQVSVEEG